MQYVKTYKFLTVALTIMTLIGCKAEITNDKETPAAASLVSFRVYCSKLILMKVENKVVKYAEEVDEGKSKKEAEATKRPEEFIALFTYELKEYSDGSRDIECTLNDFSREYYANSSVSARNAPYSDNLCSITYDLGGPSAGSWGFSWHNTYRTMSYSDDYEDYYKDFHVRGSECSEL